MTRILAVLLIVMHGAANAESLRPRVFVSIPPQKQFVERIAGDRLEVSVMLPPGEAPETFSPSPKLIASLSKAVSYFQIGVPFERYWLKAIVAANNNIHILACCEQLMPLAGGLPDEEDMHIWTNPLHVQALAKIILDELILIDPDNSAEYINNYKAFIDELSGLDMEIRDRLSTRETDYFIVSHSGWGAFAKQYGLVQLALEKNGKEIGPRALTGIIRTARAEKLSRIFVMQQYHTPFIDNLAEEIDAEVIALDPLAEDYITNMYRVVDEIANSLRSR